MSQWPLLKIHRYLQKKLTRRLPKTVKAKRRVFLYDNSCNLHKNALKRDPKEISKFKIFTDRHHWKNHTGCSESYNSDRYNYLKNVNTQICEQKNRSLRKLSSTFAYCSFNNYMTKDKLFFINHHEELWKKNVFYQIKVWNVSLLWKCLI